MDAVDCLVAVDKSIAFECGYNVFQPGPIGFFFRREQAGPEFCEPHCLIRRKAAQKLDNTATPDTVGLAPMRRFGDAGWNGFGQPEG